MSKFSGRIVQEMSMNPTSVVDHPKLFDDAVPHVHSTYAQFLARGASQCSSSSSVNVFTYCVELNPKLLARNVKGR